MNRQIAKILFFFPIRYIRGENFKKYLAYVQYVERLDSEQLRVTQWEKLINILNYAYNYIPYYRMIFKENGLKPKDIQNPTDLLSLPPLTKGIIRKNRDGLRCKRVIRISKRITSGSTAEPLRFEKDRVATACMDAIQYNSYSWYGIRIGSPQARFWSVPTGFKSRIESMIMDFLMNRIRLNALKITNKEMLKFYKKLKMFNPKYFCGYPSLIYEFAVFIKKENLSVDFLKINAIIGTGEMTTKKQISLIEEVFQTSYVNEYGCTETGLIGFTCKNKSLHLMAHNIYLECVKDGRHVLDEPGEFFVTELNALTYPFIRYKIDDRGILSTMSCKCGLNLPIIKDIVGRTVHNLETASGRKINDSVFEYLMKDRIDDCVISFKAVQTRIDKIDIYLVVNEKFKKDSIKNYIKALEKHSFGEINFNANIVSELPRENSGKNRVFVSRI